MSNKHSGRSNVWLTSDWHLGHPSVIKFRDFATVEEHDECIVDNLNRLVTKNEKLFVLGDVCWNKKSLETLGKIKCRNMELIIGNHDTLQTQEYLKYFSKVHGFRKYKNYFLSHCPIHPQELYRVKGNIHGHIHNGAATPPLELPYLNVNVDFNRFMPVNLDEIDERFEGYAN